MPKNSNRVEAHRLFPFEKWGDSWIIRPSGDPAGFANIYFGVEHASLVKLLKGGAAKNLVVDLGASNYFGAKILGAMAEWAEIVQAQGGEFAVCNASSDMRQLFEIFHFGDWPQYDSREQAIGTVINKTFRDHLQFHQKKVALVIFAVAAVILIWQLPWRLYYARYVNRKDYETVTAIWKEMQRLKASNAAPVEWRKLQNRAERELDPLIDRLEARAGGSHLHGQVAQCLLFAVRDNIRSDLLVDVNRFEIYRPVGEEKERYWKQAAVHMKNAERLMNGESIESPNGHGHGSHGQEGNAEIPVETPSRFEPAIAEPPPHRRESVLPNGPFSHQQAPPPLQRENVLPNGPFSHQQAPPPLRRESVLPKGPFPPQQAPAPHDEKKQTDRPHSHGEPHASP